MIREEQENYFKILKPMRNVIRIEDPYGVYSTLLMGEDKSLLIDTGMGFGDMRSLVNGLTDRPLTVVNSHGHNDHIGGNYQFGQVFMSPLDIETAKAALSAEVKKRVLDAVPNKNIPKDFDPVPYMTSGTAEFMPLSPGEIFNLGGLTVKTVLLGCHSPGSVGYLCPELELLISGDAIAPMAYLFYPGSSGIPEYIRMLKRVRSELRFEYLMTSHSERLIPKEELSVYIACAEAAYNTSRRTGVFVDDIFPELPAARFIYIDKDCKNSAVLIYDPTNPYAPKFDKQHQTHIE